jgi:xanthine/uracil permease
VFDQVTGLPVHVLVIHAVVVLVPLIVLTALAYALVPQWRWLLRWPLLAGSAGCLAAGFVAKKSGEAFFDRLNEPEFVAEHAARGQLLVWLLLAFFLVSAAAAFMLGGPTPLLGGRERAGAARPVQMVVAALLVVVALGTGVQVVRTGDAGARATWSSAPAGGTTSAGAVGTLLG